MGFWLTRVFGLNEINAVADKLADMLERHAPGDKWRNTKLVKSGLHDMTAYAKGEKRKQGWGTIKLAILSNRVLWKLVERGYPKDFAKEVSTTLSIFLARDVNTVIAARKASKNKSSTNKRRAT